MNSARGRECLQPGVKRTCLSARFALANSHAHPVIAKREIFNVQSNELGTAERTGKAEQEQGAVTRSKAIRVLIEQGLKK